MLNDQYGDLGEFVVDASRSVYLNCVVDDGIIDQVGFINVLMLDLMSRSVNSEVITQAFNRLSIRNTEVFERKKDLLRSLSKIEQESYIY